MLRDLLRAAYNFFRVVDAATGARVAPSGKGVLVGWKYHVP